MKETIFCKRDLYFQGDVQYAFTGWPRPIGCPTIRNHFPQKSPLIGGSFAKNDLQLKAFYGSWPPCTVRSVLLWVCSCNCKDELCSHMTDSIENATPPKSSRSSNLKSSVQIQITLKFQFEFVPRDTEGSKFLDLVDFKV